MISSAMLKVSATPPERTIEGCTTSTRQRSSSSRKSWRDVKPQSPTAMRQGDFSVSLLRFPFNFAHVNFDLLKLGCINWFEVPCGFCQLPENDIIFVPYYDVSSTSWCRVMTTKLNGKKYIALCYNAISAHWRGTRMGENDSYKPPGAP